MGKYPTGNYNGDVVGMSTVHEVVAARHCDLRSVLLISPKSYPILSFNHKNPPMVENSTTRPPSWRKLWLKDTADPILSLITLK